MTDRPRSGLVRYGVGQAGDVSGRLSFSPVTAGRRYEVAELGVTGGSVVVELYGTGGEVLARVPLQAGVRSPLGYRLPSDWARASRSVGYAVVDGVLPAAGRVWLAVVSASG